MNENNVDLWQTFLDCLMWVIHETGRLFATNGSFKALGIIVLVMLIVAASKGVPDEVAAHHAKIEG